MTDLDNITPLPRDPAFTALPTLISWEDLRGMKAVDSYHGGGIKDDAEFVSFGTGHVHRVAGITLDINIVAIVRDREQAFELFGPKFCTSCSWEVLSKSDRCEYYFPRGFCDFTNC